ARARGRGGGARVPPAAGQAGRAGGAGEPATPRSPAAGAGREVARPAGRPVRRRTGHPDLADQLNGPPGPDGKPAPLRAPFSVAPRESTEMTDLATNFPLLEEIAAKSDGRVFTAETAAELADLLAAKAATRTVQTETKLWRAWPTLFAFLGLLTVE